MFKTRLFKGKGMQIVKMRAMIDNTPISASLLESDFLDYLNYVLVDYDDVQWETHVKRVMSQIMTLKNETKED